MTGRADNGRRLAGLTPLLASVGLHALLGLVVWRTPLSPSTAGSAASTGFDERVMLLEDLPPRPRAQSEADSPQAPGDSLIPPALQPAPQEPPTARANAPEPTPARPIALGDPDSRAATTPDFLASKRDGEHNAQLAQTNQAQLTRDRDLLGDGRPLAPAQRPSPPSAPSAPSPPLPAITPAPAVPAQPPEPAPAPAITAPMPGTAPPAPTPSTAPLSVTTTPVAQPVLPVTGIKEPKQPGDADATRQQDEAIATQGELRPPDARPTLSRPPEIERRAIDQPPTPAATPPLTPPTSPAPAEVPMPAAPSASGPRPLVKPPAPPASATTPPAPVAPALSITPPPPPPPPVGLPDAPAGTTPSAETRPEIRPQQERIEESPAKTDTSLTSGASSANPAKPATDAPAGEAPAARERPVPQAAPTPAQPPTPAASAQAPANAPATPPAAAKPPTPGSEPGSGGSPTATPGEASNRESDATSTVRRAGNFRNGRIDVGEGLEIRTARPNLTLLARASTAPRPPLAEVYFDRTGTVVDVKLIESSGYPTEVDEPVRTALYRWRARGNVLDELPETADARVVLNIRVFLY